MIKKRILHWIIIEESRDNTTFEGSLQSKMSVINFSNDIKDGLKAERNINSLDSLKGASAILTEEMMKQSIIAIFWFYFFARIDFYILNITEEVQ
ncbi:MAG: hypothetical protein ACXACO_19815 [Promethearchaeota archaeon]|jgi:hypothetical protein